ncbi:hypothetical protein IFO69_03105 [Echinicola sp. CAU 1574]|uniref:tRNA (Guanine-N1)-methyltransferase n=1 Tax=Echinicola arenosa TaxID=2774144 RepID=A0ABR9AJE1_9BACT|nr:hypothetical protein [Echinicola arenosa]MBD8487729.1 hypothetical protein [Echinicola arenosa]
MKRISLIALFTCFIAVSTTFAQETVEQEAPKNSLNGGTIESQFEYLNDASNNYQEYKVVKKTNLDKIKSNILDSLKVFKDQIIEKNAKINEQNAEIKQLNTGIENTKNELNTALEAKDSFPILGLQVYKTTYSTIMWSVIIALGIALAFFIFKYSKSHKVISQTRKDLTETKDEFENHRKNTLERERKLKRQLVDEMNKKQGITS